MLEGYDDQEVIEWLRYGFSVSRQDSFPHLMPAASNHLGATLFPEVIDEYIKKEVALGATIGPFKIPPFFGGGVGVSPLSTRPKRESGKRRIIMDLSFPFGTSVNDSIDKNHYCSTPVDLTYPTINTLARRITQLGAGCQIWKKDMIRAFRQIYLCPRDYRLIAFRWRRLLYFDKVVPIGLRSAAYICQRVTNAIVYAHRNLGFWSINYLDDFASAELEHRVWQSYEMFEKILQEIGVKEAVEKAVPPTTKNGVFGKYSRYN